MHMCVVGLLHLHLCSRKRHARDKQKLQHLISELDQYVKEMDSGSKRHEIGVRGYLCSHLCSWDGGIVYMEPADSTIVVVVVSSHGYAHVWALH